MITNKISANSYRVTILNETSSIKDIVTRILEVDEEARNSDNYLIMRYWYETTGKAAFSPIDFKRHFCIGAASAESIIRARRTIQNEEHKLLPTEDEVIKKRRIKESILREYYGTNK